MHTENIPGHSTRETIYVPSEMLHMHEFPNHTHIRKLDLNVNDNLY